MQRSPGIYQAGTIAGTVGSPVIIGTGTTWATTDATGDVSYNVAAFDELVMPGQRPLLILSVDGLGQLTLNENLSFPIPAGSAYTIIRRTPVPSSTILGTMQQVLKQGSDQSPDLARTVDNGVSRLKVDFDSSGKIRFRVGATGADGSAGNPYFLALLVDPTNGNVTATGLTGGGSGAGAVLPTVGKPSNAVGLPGSFAIDGQAAVLYGPKSSNNTWPAGLTLVGPASDPTALNNAVSAAAASAALAAAWAATADNTDVPGAAVGSRSAMHYADKAATVLAGALRFDQTQGLNASQRTQGAANLGLNAAQPAFRNWLRNSQFTINQRGVSGTVTLAAGQFGHDGWKAGAGGCTYQFATQSDGTVYLNITAGTLLQVVPGKWVRSATAVLRNQGAGPSQGRVYQSGGNPAYAPTALGLAVTGLTTGANLYVEFGVGVVYLPQLEPGANPTAFEWRDGEMHRCLEFTEVGQAVVLGYTSSSGSGNIGSTVQFKAAKAAVPTVATASVTQSVNAAAASYDSILTSGARYLISSGAAGLVAVIVTWIAVAEPS